MAANVLNSERAVAMSVYVVRAFVKLREVLASSKELAKKLEDLERKLTARQHVHEKAILQIFSQIRNLLIPPPPQQEPSVGVSDFVQAMWTDRPCRLAEVTLTDRQSRE
jgi:predicted DNA binding protein